MKNVLTKLVVLSASLLLGNGVAVGDSCCPPQATGDTHGHHADMTGHHVSGHVLEAKAFKALLPAYLAIQEALAADDFEKARSAGSDLAGKAADYSSETAKHIAMASRSMADAADIDAARKAFLGVSKTMIATAKAVDVTYSSELYLAHCPMAFGNTGGSWLQDESLLANPYYGSMMLRCGSITQITE